MSDKVTITIRLSKSIHEKIGERATRELRSFTAQVENDLATREWTDTDMLVWARVVMQREGNPPYVLEEIMKQLKNELEQFRKTHGSGR